MQQPGAAMPRGPRRLAVVGTTAFDPMPRFGRDIFGDRPIDESGAGI